ncbi:unnamed protein product, partial [Heligmosomoides polygyrus]
YNIEKDIAAYIKKEFDKKYNPTWHCIVGRNFGSYVTHETKHFIYFYLGQIKEHNDVGVKSLHKRLHVTEEAHKRSLLLLCTEKHLGNPYETDAFMKLQYTW